MYLSAEKFVSGYEFDKHPNFDKLLEMLNLSKEDVPHGHAAINVTIGYWRKANAIHKWFVNNVQKGEDDCGRYYVSKERLENLKADCVDALDAFNKADVKKATEILPPAQGFFFGNTEIDSWYKRNLENTISLIDKCLSDKFKDYDFYYQSSW